MAHCIEHLYAHDVPKALAEVRRVLNQEGFACILVPDLQSVAAYIAGDRLHEPIYTSAAGPITAHDMVFGHGGAIARGQLTMAHKCGFTPSALMRQLADAGFGGYAVLRRANYELAAVVRKGDWRSLEERDRLISMLNL
jgi:hypothetical protein